MEIRRTGYGQRDAQRLAADLAEELLERHGRPSSGGEPPATDFEPPAGAFLVGCFEKRL